MRRVGDVLKDAILKFGWYAFDQPRMHCNRDFFKNSSIFQGTPKTNLLVISPISDLLSPLAIRWDLRRREPAGRIGRTGSATMS